ncbi:MAG: Fic family protein [Coriobacteriia bacterium]|nr:Fic family protein [Coriobacteriia bacterium]
MDISSNKSYYCSYLFTIPAKKRIKLSYHSPKYKTLKRVFYEDASNARFENNQAEAQRRFKDLSTFRSGIQLRTGELFYTVPRELVTLTEKVLRLERKVSQLWRSLPPIALGSYIRDLIAQEIVSTNEIEGIRSTRKEIEEALSSLDILSKQREHRRFKEFARLYLNLTKDEMYFPQSPADVRRIYDDVIAGELAAEDVLDGELFRASSVKVTDGQKTIHEGVTPEAKIIEMLQTMILLVENEDMPAIYNALLSHFLFEYIHPFYDGNGRTGRFLLALYLSVPLSMATALSLSRVIVQNLSLYYQAFEETEDKLNHGDATYFLLEMMRFIQLAQENLVEELRAKEETLSSGGKRIADLALENDVEEAILYSLLQVHLFATVPAETLDALAAYVTRSKATARKHLLRLEAAGYIHTVSRRPLSFALSEKTLALLG